MNTLLIFSVLIGIVLCDDGSQKELENFQLGNEQFSGSILSVSKLHFFIAGIFKMLRFDLIVVFFF